MLEAVDNIDERKYKARCTSTLAFCHGEGFGAIEYNPIRNTDQDWHHWWSLGFARIATNNGGAQYKIARNHAADQSQSVGANGSHWFHLFQNTNHHLTEGPGAPGIPMLTGAPSLIWGLAAFSFSEEEIPEGLQGVTRPDQPGRLYIPTSIEEPAGSMAFRSREGVYALTLLRPHRKFTTRFVVRNLGTQGLE